MLCYNNNNNHSKLLLNFFNFNSSNNALKIWRKLLHDNLQIYSWPLSHNNQLEQQREASFQRRFEISHVMKFTTKSRLYLGNKASFEFTQLTHCQDFYWAGKLICGQLSQVFFCS